MLSRLLIDDKAPYFVTIFVAALAWTLVRSVTQLSGLPLVEYSITYRSAGDKTIAETNVRLRNITLDKAFRCLKIFLVVPEDSQITFGSREKFQVSLGGNVLVTPKIGAASERFASFELLNLHPNGDITIAVPTSGTGTIKLLATPCETSSSAQDASNKGDGERGANQPKDHAAYIILIEKSFRTWFFEHEMTIFWVSIFLWGLLIITMLGKTKSVSPTSEDIDASG